MGQVLNIFQYQSVVYNSTTTGGAPISLSWNFPGGTPISGAGTTQTIVYNTPGIYSVTLTATDFFGTTDSLTETNIINVSPSTLIPGILGPTPSTVLMDQGYDVYDSSSGNPYPITSWYWQLPYGVTASTQNVGVTGYVDWNTLTGTYSGAPGSYYTGNISLTVNNGFNTGTAASSIQVRKMGQSELIGLNATGAIGAYSTQTGLGGGILVNPFIVPIPPAPPILETLANLGYPGTGSTAYAFHVDLRTRTGSPPSTRLNQNFHSTNEAALVQIKTGFYTDQVVTPVGFDPLGGFLIVNPFVYSTYSTVPVDNAISLGEYIVQYQSYDFYLADVNPSTGQGGLLTEVYNNRNYSVPLINYLITNPYKLIFSGNLQFVNNSGFLMGFPYIPAPGPVPIPAPPGNNPVVYSSAYLQSIGANLPQIYEVYTTVNYLGTPFGATAYFGTGLGSTGNDPLSNGNFFVAQTNSNGPGFVDYLNLSINTYIPGGTGTVIYEAQEFFNCDYSSPTGANYNPSNYYGVALKVIDKMSVFSVSISDNSSTLSNPLPVGPVIAPFTADFGNSQGSTETCSGMFAIGGSPYPAGMQINLSENNLLLVGGSIAY